MANDLWRTPPEVFEYYNNKYNFQWDVCASAENALCKKYLTEKDDFLCGGLTTVSDISYGAFHWCNPPYSNPLPFVNQCISDSKIIGAGYVMLLNVDFSTKWASKLTNIQCKIKIIKSARISFLNNNGVAVKGNSKGQCIVIIPPFVRDGYATIQTTSLDKIICIGSELLKAKKDNKQ